MKVSFEIDPNPVSIEYDRSQLKNKIRDSLVQSLIKLYNGKLISGEIKDQAQYIEFLTLIFKKALDHPSFRELKKVENTPNKFSFLPYDGTIVDNIIHGLAYNLISLCGGDKKLTKSMISNLRVLDSEGNIINFRMPLSFEISQAISADVAALTRKCVEEFLYELETTSRIMTSSELAKNSEALEASAEERDESSSDDEFKECSQDSKTSLTEIYNGDIQKRGTLNIAEEKEEDKSSNIIITNEEEGSKSDIMLHNLLSWIYELPQWLQNQILNSTPIKILIESIEQRNYFINIESIEQSFNKIISYTINNINDELNNIEEKAVAYDTSFTDSIDMNMILKDSKVSGWIFPMVAIELGNIYSSSSGLSIGFNGLDVFEVLENAFILN